ncbi:S46 family peptidase [Flammeovirgaceae bacterium SG7u.111]|nr:S46 family peptidase [Flammeovirgaceae bacterium SG7u.132]WPO38509.1 S46 family peptidase [Flammeovirgaceae bacterium SG7u.111]
MFKKLIVVTLLIVSGLASKATPPDEGMWLPMFVERLNYADMKKMGLKLSPEEIYSINNASLKDAIVMLGGGFCTAEVVSSQGLLLTNHHCAYDLIQNHSTVEKDYLKNGFWAKSLKEELPNEGLTASFLVRMEDVSGKILGELKPEMTEQERSQKIAEISKGLEEGAAEDGKYEVSVKPFFDGNEFYMFVYQTYTDVRLVGAPAESIGKFGGDTDNWMWPRHTGDFSMLRIYTGKDGNPKEYAEDNVPLKPKKHLPVSLDGVKKNDFTMVMGYPGSTDRYLTSYGVKLAIEQSNPKRVDIRGKKLELMKQDMDSDEKIRLQYASKYASVSNYWKYFIGQTKGLKRLDIYDKKKAQEEAFQNWVNADAARKEKYGKALIMLEEGYKMQAKTEMTWNHLNESVFGTEILPMAYEYSELAGALQQPDADKEAVDKMIADFRESAKKHFKDYNAPTDQKILTALLEMYEADVPADQLPDVFEVIKNDFGGDYAKYANKLFETSIFSSEEKLNKFLDEPNFETLMGDMAMEATTSFLRNYFSKIVPIKKESSALIDKGNRLYVAGLREMNPAKSYYPNANSTLRLTYGQVGDYFPEDAALYSYYTTADGILQKEDPNNPEFVVDPKLKKLIEAKDFGRYGYNGRLRVGFITNNDITGGNSGSPVINAKGELIGIAFDGNWEAMSGDIAFETELQRCINVDIRYVLFVIDKLNGAKHLVDEMTLVTSKPSKAKEFEEVMLEKY